MKTSSAVTYTVGEVARMAHVSVRTLHHYDDIGLLSPAGRSPSGYRLYDDGDLRRLHHVLLFRELGFALDAVAQLLDDPSFDRKRALQAQRELLQDRMKKQEGILRAVDAALDALDRGGEMASEKLFEGFEEFDNTPYEEEVKKHWGEGDAYKTSMRRTKSYSRDDWARIKAETEAVEAGFAKAMQEGAAPEDERAMDLAEEARLHVDRWFYPCNKAMHAGLAQMYTVDPRFKAHYEDRAEGLAEYVAAAIRANEARG